MVQARDDNGLTLFSQILLSSWTFGEGGSSKREEGFKNDSQVCSLVTWVRYVKTCTKTRYSGQREASWWHDELSIGSTDPRVSEGH